VLAPPVHGATRAACWMPFCITATFVVGRHKRSSQAPAEAVSCALVHNCTQSAGAASAGSLSALTGTSIVSFQPLHRQPLERPPCAGDHRMPAGMGETAGGDAANAAEADDGHGETGPWRGRGAHTQS